MKFNLRPYLLHVGIFTIAAALFAPMPADAEVVSRLNEITKSKKLRV